MSDVRRRRLGGFSLMELSIVLIIIGILLSITIPALSPSIIAASEAKTRALLEANVDALKGVTAAGQALPTSGTFQSVLRTRSDGAGKDFQYVYDDNLTAKGSVCNRTATSLTVQQCADAACTAATATTINNVAFVLVSGGIDGNNQTSATLGVTSNTTVRTYGYNVQGKDNYTDDGAAAATDPYDDAVAWVTLAELRTAAGCGAALSLTPTSLPAGSVSSAYSTQVIVPQGGVRFASGGAYLWCIEYDDVSGASSCGNPTATTNPADCKIGFQPDMGGALTASSTACPSDTTDARWGQANSLSIYPTAADKKLVAPSAGGYAGFRIVVSDNGGTILKYNYTLAINP